MNAPLLCDGHPSAPRTSVPVLSSAAFQRFTDIARDARDYASHRIQTSMLHTSIPWIRFLSFKPEPRSTEKHIRVLFRALTHEFPHLLHQLPVV